MPEELITSDLEGLIGKECDVVMELIGGRKRASSLVETALRLGRDVITANKALIAVDGERLQLLAEESGRSLHYSASVGGVMPALETIEQLKQWGSLK